MSVNWKVQIHDLLASRDYQILPYVVLADQNNFYLNELAHQSDKEISKKVYRSIETVDKIADLSTECKNLQRRIGLIQNEIESKNEMSAEYDTIVKNLEDQIDQNSSKFATLGHLYDELEAELQLLIQRVSKIELDNQKLSTECREIEFQHQKLLETTRKQLEENKVLEKKIQVLIAKNGALPAGQNGNAQFGSSNMAVPMKVLETAVCVIETGIELYSVCFSSSGAKFVVAGSQDSLDFYDSKKFICNYKLKSKLTNQFSEARLALFSPDDLHLLACTSDNNTHVWSYKGDCGFCENQILTKKGTTTGSHLCALFHGVDKVVTGSENYEIRVWDIQRGICASTLPCDSIPFSLVTRDELLCSGHADGTMKLWDMRNHTANSQFSFDSQCGGITSLMLVPDKEYEFVLSTKSSCLKLVDIRKQKELRSYSHTEYENTSLWAKSTLSVNGEWIYSGSKSGEIFVWEKCSGNFIKKLEGHKSIVRSFSWNNLLNSHKCSLITCDKLGSIIAWI